jgi:hypothetical protein
MPEDAAWLYIKSSTELAAEKCGPATMTSCLDESDVDAVVVVVTSNRNSTVVIVIKNDDVHGVSIRFVIDVGRSRFICIISKRGIK